MEKEDLGTEIALFLAEKKTGLCLPAGTRDLHARFWDIYSDDIMRYNVYSTVGRYERHRTDMHGWYIMFSWPNKQEIKVAEESSST